MDMLDNLRRGRLWDVLDWLWDVLDWLLGGNHRFHNLCMSRIVRFGDFSTFGFLCPKNSNPDKQNHQRTTQSSNPVVRIDPCFLFVVILVELCTHCNQVPPNTQKHQRQQKMQPKYIHYYTSKVEVQSFYNTIKTICNP